MFERNRVDNSQVQTGIPAEITLDDGSVVAGKFMIAVSTRMQDVLNSPTQYLDFETYDGQRSLIAKSSLKAVRIEPVPSSAGLSARVRDDDFDPYRILGIAQGCSWDEVKSAYHARAKTYHPDRYANAELPTEVRDYLAIMARRINAAYKALETPHTVSRRAAASRSEAVYTSARR